MRTDAKVGLIAVFVVILALVAYFAWQGKKPENPSLVGPRSENGLTMSTDSGGGGLRVIAPTLLTPATATAPASEPATTMLSGSFATTAPGSSAPVGFGVTTMTASSRPAFETAASRPAWDATPPSTRPTWESGLTLGGGTSTADRTTLSSGSSTDAAGTYTLVKNDTLAKIATKNHVTQAALKKANPGFDWTKLKAGLVVKLPATAPSTPSTPSGISSRGTTPRLTASTRPSVDAGTPGGTYTVKSGDTLTKISKQIYGDTKHVDSIAHANRAKLPNPDVLKVGQVLQLPPK